MNTNKILYDAVSASDYTAFDTSIDIKDLETGEIIFKGLKNKVIISGSGTIARKLFDISSADPIPTYNASIRNIYTPNTEIHTGAVGIGSTTANKDNPKVLLFCCGIDGCGSENSQVYPVDYKKWIDPEALIPFRYQPSGEDLSDELRQKYFGRAVVGEYISYYFKTFESAPKFVQRYMDGTPIDSSVFSSTKNDSAESFVEVNMKITKEDMRDYFIATTGIDRARINCISLCTAYPVMENGYTFYKDIRPLTRLNFPNEQLIDLSKGIEIAYHIYM